MRRQALSTALDLIRLAIRDHSDTDEPTTDELEVEEAVRRLYEQSRQAVEVSGE